MPRRIIPIRSGPAQFDFQDSAGGLTDGLAQAVATLAALPMQSRQIQQDYALRTAEVNRENRNQDASLRRSGLEDALRTGAAPVGMEQDPQYAGAVNEFKTHAHEKDLENILRQRNSDMEAARMGAYAGPDAGLGAASANSAADQAAMRAFHLRYNGGVPPTAAPPSDLARLFGLPDANETQQAPGKGPYIPSPFNPDLIHRGGNGHVEVVNPPQAPVPHVHMLKDKDGNEQPFLLGKDGAMHPVPIAPADGLSNALGAAAASAPVQFPTPDAPSQSMLSMRPSGAAGGPQTLGDVLGGRWFGGGDQGAPQEAPPAAAAPPAPPAPPAAPRGIVRQAHLQQAVQSGAYPDINAAAADAQRQGFQVVP